MAERDQEIEHPRDKTSRDFLLAEYQALVQLDGARNERLDRYLTLFLTLAGAPWALYILILKPPASTVDFAALPLTSRRPPSISSCTRDRESSGQCAATNRSSRVPASVSIANSSCISG